MAKAVWLVYTNCPADREQEFNSWYEHMHLPDLLTVEGIVGAQRFRLDGPGPEMVTPAGGSAIARYLALYELDTEDTTAVRARVRELHLNERGRGFDALEVVASTTHLATGERQTALPAGRVGAGG